MTYFCLIRFPSFLHFFPLRLIFVFPFANLSSPSHSVSSLSPFIMHCNLFLFPSPYFLLPLTLHKVVLLLLFTSFLLCSFVSLDPHLLLLLLLLLTRSSRWHRQRLRAGKWGPPCRPLWPRFFSSLPQPADVPTTPGHWTDSAPPCSLIHNCNKF